MFSKLKNIILNMYEQIITDTIENVIQVPRICDGQCVNKKKLFNDNKFNNFHYINYDKFRHLIIYVDSFKFGLFFGAPKHELKLYDTIKKKIIFIEEIYQGYN